MASKGTSLYKGSDECDLPCDVCHYQNISSRAISYCNVCKEAICAVCDKVHRASKQTRNHQLLTGDQLPPISGGSQVMPSIMTCDKHQLAIQYFCEADNDVFCSTCKLANHRKCDTNEIGTYTTENNPKKTFDGIQNKLKDLEKAYERLHKKRTNDKLVLKEQIQSCLDDTVKIRKELNEILNKLEEKMKAEIANIEKNINKEIDDHLIVADDTLRQIREKMTSFNECQNAGQPDAMFVCLKKTEGDITQYDEILTGVEKELDVIDIRFKPDDNLMAKLQELESLGRLVRSEQKQQSSSLLSMTVSDMKSYNVGCVAVQSVVFMPDDHLVLACAEDGLKLLDQNYRQKAHLSMLSAFACKTSNTEVLVSQGKHKQLQFVRVTDTLVAKEVVDVGKICNGIDYNNEEIYVACGDQGNGEIRILSKNGELKRRVGVIDGRHMFSGLINVKVNVSGDKVFVSDWVNGTLTCLDQQGRVVYKYTCIGMKGLGGLYVDEHDNTLLCEPLTHTVQVISADGKKYRTLLTETDGIRHQLCIAYRPSDGCLAIGTADPTRKGTTLFVFKTKS